MQKLLLLAFLSLPSIGHAGQYVFQGGRVIVPEFGPADPSFVIVENLNEPIIGIKVEIDGLAHKYGRELMLALSNPDGWTTMLINGGPCRMEGANVVFSDDATKTIDLSCNTSRALPSGTYLPGFSGVSGRQFSIPIAPIPPFFDTLNEMILDNLNGRWILWGEDFASGDGGVITGWRIILETASAEIPPEENPETPVPPTE